MKKFTSARLEQFPEFVFSRLGREIAAVEAASGRKVLSFGAGNPDVRSSANYLNAYKKFIDDPDSHLYPGYRGTKEWNEAMVAWYARRFGVSISTDEVLPLLGGKDGLAHIPPALADTGDEILVPDPGYPSFTEAALLFGVVPVPYTLAPEDRFTVLLDELEKKCTPRTRYIVLNFPSNPTGVVAEKTDLAPLVAFAKRRNIPLIYDNAYSEITYDGFVAPSILEIDGARDIAVEMGSFSKMFSFAGFRMGWIAGNRDIIEALAKVKTQMDSGMSLPLQRLAAFALTHPDDAWHAHMIESYRKRRDIVAKKLTSLGLKLEIPRGSLYLWARIPENEKNAESYSMRMLKEKQVFFTPGSAYGKNGERFVRVSFCVNVDKIDEYL